MMKAQRSEYKSRDTVEEAVRRGGVLVLKEPMKMEKDAPARDT